MRPRVSCVYTNKYSACTAPAPINEDEEIEPTTEFSDWQEAAPVLVSAVDGVGVEIEGIPRNGNLEIAFVLTWP